MKRLQILLGTLALLVAMAISAHAVVLFEEDFDDGSADGFTPIGPGWEVVDGAYTCETTGYEIYSSSVFGDPEWTDVAISFDIKSEESVNHLLRFRVNDFEDFYLVNLRSAPWNDVRVTRTMNTLTEDLAIAKATLDNGIWHGVRVVASGFLFQIYLDDHLVLNAVDNEAPERLRDGQCAVVSYSGGVMQHQIVSYDNIVVETQIVPAENTSWSSVKALFE